MAIIGVSKPYYAKYTVSNGAVAYSDLTNLAKATSAEINMDNADAVVQYADNAAAETANGFSGGTLTLGIDELSVQSAAGILGIDTESVSTPSGTAVTMKAGTAAPYLGIGLIVKKQVNNAPKWMGVVLYKVQFQTPGLTAETQGETITFQTPELTATILRDDTADQKWCSWGEFATEADALTWISGKLGGN